MNAKNYYADERGMSGVDKTVKDKNRQTAVQKRTILYLSEKIILLHFCYKLLPGYTKCNR